MTIRLNFTPYGVPGDVEYKKITSPATVTAWGEAAKKAASETGNFVPCETWTEEGEGTETSQKISINLSTVQSVYPD